MQVFIPKSGDVLVLKQSWKFPLPVDLRNRKFLTRNVIDAASALPVWVNGGLMVEFPAGTRLKVDLVQVPCRGKGSKVNPHVVFWVNPNLRTRDIVKGRIVVLAEDMNNVQCDVEES